MTEASDEIKRRRLLTAGPPFAKKRRRRRQSKGSPVSEMIGLEKMEKGLLESESSDLKVSMDLPCPDELRHNQSDGLEWRFFAPVKPALCYVRGNTCCKQPNEGNIEALESKPKKRHRRPSNPSPLTQGRRRRPSNLEDPIEEPVRMPRRKEGECDMEAAGPAVSRDFPIPDTLRCRRSDGRKWRCPQPVMSGLSYCEYHLMRCKQTYNKNAKVKIANPDRGSPVATDPQWCTKRQRWRRLIGERRAEGPIWTEKNEEALESAKPATWRLDLCGNDNKSKAAEKARVCVRATEPATPDVKGAELGTADLNVFDTDLLCCAEGNKKFNEVSAMPKPRQHLSGDPQPSRRVLSLPDHLRCRRSDGRKWRCTQLALPTVGFCEYHHLQMRRNQGKSQKTKFASTAKRKRGPGLVGNPLSARKLRQQRVRIKIPVEVPRRVEQDGGERSEAANLEVMRDLPNGVMAISSGTARFQSIASPSLDRKLGSDNGYLLGRLFRSKNAERVPLANVQKLPFFWSMGGNRKSVCHRCRGWEKKVAARLLCLNCQEYFCTTCIETWHPELSEFEVESCPVCRGCCSCINCNSRRDQDEISNSSKQGQRS